MHQTIKTRRITFVIVSGSVMAICGNAAYSPTLRKMLGLYEARFRLRV